MKTLSPMCPKDYSRVSRSVDRLAVRCERLLTSLIDERSKIEERLSNERKQYMLEHNLLEFV